MPFQPQRVLMSGGVNLLADPRRIKDTECVTLQNLAPLRSGMLSTRGAIAHSTTVDVTSTNPIPNMLDREIISYARPAIEGDLTAVLVLQSLNPVTVTDTSIVLLSDTVTYPINQLIIPNFTPSIRPPIVSINNKIYILLGPGAPYPGVVISKNPGGGYDIDPMVFTGTNNEDIRPSVMASYRGRAVYGNLGPGREDWVMFSGTSLDPHNPLILKDDAAGTASNQATILGGFDGDRITGMVQIMLTAVGSPAQSALMVFKEQSGYMLTGELWLGDYIPGPTENQLGSLEVANLPTNCGCVSQETIAKSPYGVFWASTNDVWMFDAGQVPRRIGTKLRPRLEGCAPQTRYRWHAVYFNGFYRLAIRTGGSDDGRDYPTNTATGRCNEQWWLQLSDGPPSDYQEAAWFGPQIYKLGSSSIPGSYANGTVALSVEMRAGRDNRLYGADVTDSRVNAAFEPTIYECDILSAYDNALDSVTLDRPLTDGTYIVPKVVTKNLDLGTGMHKKMYNKSTVDLWVGNRQRMTGKAVLDDGRETDTAIVDIIDKGLLLGADTLFSTNMFKQFQPISITPSRSRRYTGHTVRLELLATPGILIDETNDQFVYTTQVAPATTYLLTLTRGFYATLTTFLDHLISLLNTTEPGNPYEHNVLSITNRPFKLAISRVTTFPVKDFTFNFVAGYAIDTLKKSRQIGAMLGYNTSANVNSGSSIATASDGVYYRQGGRLELAEINMSLRGIKRGPQ